MLPHSRRAKHLDRHRNSLAVLHSRVEREGGIVGMRVFNVCNEGFDDGLADGLIDGLVDGVLVAKEVEQDPSGTTISSLMGETVLSGNSSSLSNSTRLVLSSARELEKKLVRTQPLSALPPRQSRIASSNTSSSHPAMKSA